jgi:hypothetical protein
MLACQSGFYVTVCAAALGCPQFQVRQKQACLGLVLLLRAYAYAVGSM